MTSRLPEASNQTAPPPSIIVDVSDGAGLSAATPRPRGTVVLLLSGAVDRRWAADVAIELGEVWAKDGRRIVLADLHLEAPLLHAGLDVSNMEGVVDIFLYGASLSRIARPVRGGAFYLIPAGTYAPDAGEIYRHPRWKKLVAGFRDSDASLVLFVPGDSADLKALGLWSTEVIVIGPPPAANFLDELRGSGMKVLAVLEPPVIAPASLSPVNPPPVAELAPAVAAAAAAVEVGVPSPAAPVDVSSVRSRDRADEVGARPPPRERIPPPAPILPRAEDPELELPPPPVRRTADRRRASAVIWIIFAVILLGIAGYLIAVLRPDLFSGGSPSVAPLASAASEPPAPTRQGEMIPYSVHVKAFTSLSAAANELVEDQQRLASAPFFISPEEIQGILYYRILAGLSTDSLGATRLRDHLVEAGAIDPEDAAGSWSLLQFTPLTFDLGEFETEEEARLRADSLFQRQIPTYTAAVPYSDGTQRYQLYGGAYGDSVTASQMRMLLESAGISAKLTSRTGLPATLPE